MRSLSAMCFGLAVAASFAGAQCPAPTQPVILPVFNPGSQFTGSTRVAADDGIVVTNSAAGMTPVVQIHRLGVGAGGGWGPDSVIVSPAGVHGLAVRGEVLVVRSGAAGSLRLNVHVRDVPSNSWSLVTTLISTNATDSAFGQGLTFDASGTHFAFRSQGAPDRVFVYAAGSDGSVVFAGAIEDPEPAPNHSFGFDIALDDDLLAVSAPGDSIAGPHAGAVYVFRRVDGAWEYVQKLIPPFTSTSDHFGQSVALHAGTLVVGAVHSSGIVGDVGGIDFANGFARVYQFNGDTFDLAAHLVHPIAPAGATAFGHDVAVRGGRLLVAAFQDDLTGSRAGSALVYDRVQGAWVSNGAHALTGGDNGWFGVAIAMTDDHAFGVAPLLRGGSVAAAVFDRCALHPLPTPILSCTPGVAGLFTFLGAYFRAEPQADYDRSGAVDHLDLALYLADWFAGCP